MTLTMKMTKNNGGKITRKSKIREKTEVGSLRLRLSHLSAKNVLSPYWCRKVVFDRSLLGC